MQIWREIEFDLQIIISNRRLDVEQYLSKYFSMPFHVKNVILQKIYRHYLSDMRQKLLEENIYEAKYYIVVTLLPHQDIIEVDRVLEKLRKIGCPIQRVQEASVMEQILYESMHKSYQEGGE